MADQFETVTPAESQPGTEVAQQKTWEAPSTFAGEGSAPKWASDAKVYEFNDDFGEIGPKVPELELDLFGDPKARHEKTALDFTKIEEIDVHQEGPIRIKPIATFETAGLHPAMLENVELCGYQTLTPIQRYCIPSILQGRDVIGIAQTGSGKTAAYLIPILSKLMGKAKQMAAPRPNPATFREGLDNVVAEPLVLIVAPTRELATQIWSEARKLTYRTMLRPAVLYGGVPINHQIHLLSKGVDILVGTPGRLVDFIRRPNYLSLRRLRYVIIDEADEMLQQDWEADIQQILSGGEQDEGSIQYGLFSATFQKDARTLAKDYLSAEHVRFRVGRAGSTTGNIRQRVVEVEQYAKKDLLIGLLDETPNVRTIIFINSRVGADNLDAFLFNLGFPVNSIHGERTQLEREDAMVKFRGGTHPILIATGVTARGIDVRNVMHIINYDLPSTEYGGINEYVHRIGRTGRIGHRGVATSMYTDRDESIASDLTRILMETKQEIPEFLAMYRPEDAENLDFDDDSDEDDTNAEDGDSNNEAQMPAGEANTDS